MTLGETRRPLRCQLSITCCVGHPEHSGLLVRLRNQVAKATPAQGINQHFQSLQPFPGSFRVGFRWWMPVVHARS